MPHDQRIFFLVESKSKEANLVDETQAEVFMRNTIPEGMDVGQPKEKGRLTMSSFKEPKQKDAYDFLLEGGV